MRLRFFLWGVGCACGLGVRHASSPSSFQAVRKDEALIAGEGAGELGAENGPRFVAVVALCGGIVVFGFSAICVLCEILIITYATVLIHGRVAALDLNPASLCSRVAPFPATRPQLAMTFTGVLVP